MTKEQGKRSLKLAPSELLTRESKLLRIYTNLISQELDKTSDKILEKCQEYLSNFHSNISKKQIQIIETKMEKKFLNCVQIDLRDLLNR